MWEGGSSRGVMCCVGRRAIKWSYVLCGQEGHLEELCVVWAGESSYGVMCCAGIGVISSSYVLCGQEGHLMELCVVWAGGLFKVC